MKRVRCARVMRRRIGQWIDDLQLLDDRARPSVRDDERQGIFMLGANVDEMNVQAIWRDPLSSVRSVRESYRPFVGKEDDRSDGTEATQAYAGADHQEVA